MFRIVICCTLALVFVDTRTFAQEAVTTSSKLELPETDEGLAGEGPIRRYEWFRNLWRNRRAAFEKRANKENNAFAVTLQG